MIFRYEAVNNAGTMVNGEVEASTSGDAIRILRSRQLVATEVNEAGGSLRPSVGKKQRGRIC